MSTHNVRSANLMLTARPKADIAAAITRSRHEPTGAPSFPAQVIFSETAGGMHYIGGKGYRAAYLFVHGFTSAEIKAALIKDIVAKVQAIAGIAPEDIWVYIHEFSRPR